MHPRTTSLSLVPDDRPAPAGSRVPHQPLEAARLSLSPSDHTTLRSHIPGGLVMSSPRIANARSPLAGVFVAFVGLLVAGVAPALATTIFQQDFQSSTTLSSYFSATPNSGQWDDIGGAASIVTISGNNSLRFTRSANGDKLWFTRSTNLNAVTPLAIIYKFDLSVTSVSSAGSTPSILRVGRSFVTGNSDAADDSTYAKLGILVDASTTWRLQNIATTTNSSSFSGTQTVWWVLNNSGATLTYVAPNLTTESIANDKADVWVGTTKVFDDVSVQT